MRSRDLVGKTIAGITQEQVDSNSGTREWSLKRITFTDGSALEFVTIELACASDYGLHGVYLTAKEAS